MQWPKISMRLELTKGSGHYFEVPNKRVTFLFLFEKFFPPPRFFTLTQIKQMSISTFFHVHEWKKCPTYIHLSNSTRLLGTF